MSKFRVYFKKTITTMAYVDVEAVSEDEADELANSAVDGNESVLETDDSDIEDEELSVDRIEQLDDD